VLAVLAGFISLAGGMAGFGQAVVGAGLLVAVAGPAGEGERGGVPVAGLSGPARGQQGLPRPVERLGLPARVADLPVGGEGLLVVAAGLVKVPLLAKDRRERPVDGSAVLRALAQIPFDSSWDPMPTIRALRTPPSLS